MTTAAAEPLMNGAIYERTSILVGDAGLRRLQNARVLVVGVGGVGGHCAEALVRSGVGNLYICDHDVVSLTNKNRQLSALDSTVGLSKARVLANRFADINRACNVAIIDSFLLPDDIPEIVERENFDCIVDCIDSVDCKIALVAAAAKRNIVIFVAGGAGGRTDATQLRFADVFDTEHCAMLKRLRTELRRFGVGFGQAQCVFSNELARQPLPPSKQDSGGRDRAINGTMSYIPPMFGLMLASKVIQFVLDPTAYRAGITADIKRRLKAQKMQGKKERRRQREEEGGGAGGAAVAVASTSAGAATTAVTAQQRRQRQNQQPGPEAPAAQVGDDGAPRAVGGYQARRERMLAKQQQQQQAAAPGASPN